MIYIIVLFFLLILSIRYDINERVKGRDFWYYAMMVMLILIAGLRWRLGIDTPNTLDWFYNSIPYLWDVSLEDFAIGKKPLWFLANSLVYTISGRFFVLQLLQSTFVNILIFNYIKKHSRHIFTCAFFYFVFFYIGFNMETMKAGCAIVVSLYANDYLIDKKWLKVYVLYVVAFLFHPQALLLLFTPLFLWLKLDIKGIMFLLGAYIVGYITQVAVGDYLFLVEELGDDAMISKANAYADSDKYISQTNSLLYMIVTVYPLIIYSIICLYYTKRIIKNERLLRFQPFVIMGVACLFARLNCEIFYRFTFHYTIYFVIFFSEVFVDIVKSCKKLSFGVSYLKSIIIFSPLIICMLSGYIRKSVRYYPYSSVIERKIDKERESSYQQSLRPSANDNQY